MGVDPDTPARAYPALSLGESRLGRPDAPKGRRSRDEGAEMVEGNMVGGSSEFSRTLEAHNRAVSKYQRGGR